MSAGRSIPFSGILLALATGGVLLAAGSDPWLVAGTMLVWIASFWLAASPPDPPAQPISEGVQLSHGGVRDLIERSAVPMVLLDGERIVIANAAAREVLGAHVLGQDARVALRHPEAVDLLSREGGGSATIHGLTGPRSSWEMSRQPIDARYSLIELINRSAEADVSRAHTDFVANASHELRTPLASVIGYIETMIDAGDNLDPKTSGRFLSTVLREARRLQSLVEDLMSLSRVEAEKHDQPRERVDLALLVPRASRDAAGAERLDRLDMRIGEPSLIARGDPQQLEQLVRNLVDNALKYGTPGTKVHVSLTADEATWAVCTIRDHSEGIASEHIPHLTRRFYRTDPGRSRAAGGTGLGLSIVKHIVERHRGRLDIKSKRSEGTTVTVRLPLAD